MQHAGTILLVDDSPGECELFQAALRQSGFHGTLEIAHQSAAALRYLESAFGTESSVPSTHPAHPTLIVLDLKLRGEQGLTLLNHLKQRPGFAHIPVVILTTSDDRADIEACYQAGANSYLVKPERFDDLVAVTHTLWKYWVECNCPATTRLAC